MEGGRGSQDIMKATGCLYLSATHARLNLETRTVSRKRDAVTIGTASCHQMNFFPTVTTASGDRILQQFPGVPTSVVLQLTLLHQKSISFFAKFLVGVLFIGIRLVENRL